MNTFLGIEAQVFHDSQTKFLPERWRIENNIGEVKS